MGIQAVHTLLRRLRRHYEVVIREYDQISFMEMVHSLRCFAEYKNSSISECLPSFEKERVFPSAVPNKQCFRLCKDVPYILAYMPPNGLITYANLSLDGRGRSLVTLPEIGNQNFTPSLRFMYKEDGANHIDDLAIIYKALDENAIKVLYKKTPEKRVSIFNHWLNHEVVRCQLLVHDELKSYSISRVQLIESIANTDGSSHNILAEKYKRNTDEPIKWLNAHACGGLPIPYFLLLKIAQDILENFPKIIEQARNQPSRHPHTRL